MRLNAVILAAFFTGSAAGAMAQGTPLTRYITPGQQVKLTATASSAPHYQWYRDGLPLNGARTRELLTSVPGTYTVQAYYRLECPSDFSPPVVIREIAGTAVDLAIGKQADKRAALVDYSLGYLLTVTNNGPQPAAAVMVTDALPRQLGLESIGTPSAGTASYDPATRRITWQVGELGVQQPATLALTTKVLEAGAITNTASVTAAQQDSVPGNNTAVHVQQVLPVHIPNTITPNGDGINDRLHIRGLERYPENELIILNRWGNHVFEQKNYQQNWEGKGLTEGTYFYLLRIKDEGGHWQDFKGYIMILRSR